MIAVIIQNFGFNTECETPVRIGYVQLYVEYLAFFLLFFGVKPQPSAADVYHSHVMVLFLPSNHRPYLRGAVCMRGDNLDPSVNPFTHL
jgi:hypothetical protein